MANKQASTQERWFAATLVFVSRIGDATSMRPLCEERIVLLHATSEEDAAVQAVTYGRREQHSYRNRMGQPVEWQFAGIERVEEAEPDPESTAWEVASRFMRRGYKSLQALRRDGTEPRKRAAQV